MQLLRRLPRFSIRHLTKPGGRSLPGFVFFCLLLLPAVGWADAGILSDLVGRAREKNLAAEPYWATLLHYRPSVTGLRSLIDDPRFFLADDGDTDPRAELEQTLAAFFRPVGDDPDQHPRCRFPARYDWLDQALDLTPHLPELTCPKFERIRAEILPESAELIFPGANFNNPASMFGHTLININGPYRSKLLSHALNYSAYTLETNGIAYAVKGILGFYKGFYSVLPYYAKLKQYNDLERRDIWEYQLNLDPEEMARMFRHVWELEDIWSDYYFFDENCAYQLLFLFDAARPSLRLVEQARPWVIPVDTVRLLDRAGVISRADYRPSKATRIAWLVDHMSGAERERAAGLLSGELRPEDLGSFGLDLPQQVRVLDLATETVEFMYLRREIDRAEYRQRYLALLQQRSYLRPEAAVVPPIPVPTRPDRGHGSNRLSLQGGEFDGRAFAELQFRPAYHDLLDADAGYLPGSQIEFADLSIRGYSETEIVRLHAFDLVSIVSLTPRHRFYKPVSWKVDAGFERRRIGADPQRLVFSLNPGGGFAFGDDRTMTYALVETDLQFSGHYRDRYLLGFGGSGGVLARLGRRLKVKADIRQIGFVLGDETHRTAVATAGINWSFGPHGSLVVEASRRREQDIYASEIKGGLNIYW